MDKMDAVPLANFAAAEPHGALFRGANVLRAGQKLRFEAPVRFESLRCVQGMAIGAYSFMRPAYVVGNPVIGRYCSIGADASIGEPDHPLRWLGTGSFQYELGKFAFHDPARRFVGRPRPAELTGDDLPTRVGNDVWIGSRVMVLKGVVIGDGAVIAAGAVVAKNVPAYAIAGGVPAKLIRYRFEDKGLIAALRRIKWWEFLAPALSGLPFDDPPAAIAALERREAAGEIARVKPRYAVIRNSAKGLEYVPPRPLLSPAG